MTGVDRPDDAPRRRSGRAAWWTLTLLLAGAAWLAWHGWATTDEAAPVLVAEAAAPAPPSIVLQAAPAPADRSASAAMPSAARALPSCPHQHLDIALPGGSSTACVSATRSQQTGSVQRLVVEAEGTSNWRLRAELGGGRVRALELAEVLPARPGTEPATYACKGKSCVGAVASEGDPPGTRRLALANVPLKPAADGDARAAITVSAMLELPAAGQSGAHPCRVPSVTVLDARGGTFDLCPEGSTGFEVGDDDRLRYVFMDLEGRRMTVSLGTEGAIESVTLGAYACTAPECGGVSRSEADAAAPPGGERSFSFSGTSLRAGAARVTLQGTLTMPDQDPDAGRQP